MGLSKFQSANFWRGKNGEHDEEPLDFGYPIHASTRGTGSCNGTCLGNCEENSNLLPRQNGQFFLFNILVKLRAF